MILYWSDTYYPTEAQVEEKAKSVEIKPLQFRAVPKDHLLVHELGNGDVSDNNVGWNDEISLVISEDQFSRQITGKDLKIGELVHGWERAKFKWLRHPRVNGGRTLRVAIMSIDRSHPEDVDQFNETEYTLRGKVFHHNG